MHESLSEVVEGLRSGGGRRFGMIARASFGQKVIRRELASDQAVLFNEGGIVPLGNGRRHSFERDVRLRLLEDELPVAMVPGTCRG